MAKLYRYRPKDHRTPMQIIGVGSFEWDGVYDDPRLEGHPDFEPFDGEDHVAAHADKPADHAAGAKGGSH